MKTMMFYLVENRHIGNRKLLIEGVHDIAHKGFEGILMQVRDTAFQMDDPEVIGSVEIVTREAHRLGLKLVLTFITTSCRPWSTSFFKQHPDEGDYYVRRAEGEIREGRLTAVATCRTLNGESRIGHIDRVVAGFWRTGGEGLTRLEPFAASFSLGRQTWQDDTTDWHADPSITVRITGTVNGPPDGPVVLYVAFKVLKPDYESLAVMGFLSQLLEKYRHIPLDGTAWDEPGFHGANQMGGWNCYKVSAPFLDRFRRENGYDLCDRLPWLDENLGIESYRIRHDYFRSLNNALYDAQANFVARSRRLFGEKMFSGIHHTWVGEASVNDAYIGCSDYFYLSRNLSGGFTDGAFSYEKSMCYTLRLASSLGKFHSEGQGYSNSWDYDPTVIRVAHFTRLMAIMKLGWIGHAYGHAMGSFGAGYPLSDSWSAVGEAASRLQKCGQFLKNAHERVRIAVYHSWETPVFFNNSFAQLSKSCQLHLSLELVNASMAFDFVGSEQLAGANLEDKQLVVGSNRYDCLVVPWGCMMPDAVWKQIHAYAERGGKVIFCGPPVFCATDGRDLSQEYFRLTGVQPFTPADYQQAYLQHRPFPTSPTAVNLFHFTLEPVDGEVVFASENGCGGVKRRNAQTYYLSHTDPREKLLELVRRLGMDNRLVVNAFNAIAAVYDEDRAAVLAVTGRYDRPWSGVVRLDDHEVRVKSAKLLLLRLGPDNPEAIGEAVEGLTVDGRGVTTVEMLSGTSNR